MYYANGFFNAKSTKLLTKKDYETLLHLETEDFFTQLRNLGFGLFTAIDTIYNQNINILKKDLLTTLDSIDSLKMFFYPIDLVNTKLLFKAIYKNIDSEHYFIEGGNLSKETIYNALKNKDYKNLTREKDLFMKINELEITNFKAANNKIEHLFYEFMQNLVKDDYPLNKYLETKLNLLNILTIIRAQTLNLREEELLYNIIKTPSFDNQKGLEIYKKSLADIEIYVEKLGYYSVSEAIKAYRQHQNLERLETDFDKNFYSLMKNYTYNIDDYGFIMMYIFKKLKELENIRLIYFNRNIKIDDLFLVE